MYGWMRTERRQARFTDRPTTVPARALSSAEPSQRKNIKLISIILLKES
jgi:hypothetical protein